MNNRISSPFHIKGFMKPNDISSCITETSKVIHSFVIYYILSRLVTIYLLRLDPSRFFNYSVREWSLFMGGGPVQIGGA